MGTAKLTKLSSPGWEREFESPIEAQQELYKYICSQCRAEEGITTISSIPDMLCTACGCEFWYEEDDGTNT